MKNFFTSPLLIMFLFGGVLPIVGGYALTQMIPDWRWDYVTFHAVLEGLGAFAALIIATLVMLMRSAGKLHPGYVWVACGLISMGVLDGFHAILYLYVFCFGRFCFPWIF